MWLPDLPRFTVKSVRACLLRLMTTIFVHSPLRAAVSRAKQQCASRVKPVWVKRDLRQTHPRQVHPGRKSLSLRNPFWFRCRFVLGFTEREKQLPLQGSLQWLPAQVHRNKTHWWVVFYRLWEAKCKLKSDKYTSSKFIKHVTYLLE